MKQRLALPIVGSALAILVAGCAGTPDNAQLNEAQATYDKIEQDPDVVRSGPTQLRAAREKLEQARALQDEDADEERVTHVAYLAHRHAQIAHEQGKQAELQKQIDSAESRREELKLKMQTMEARQARQEAQELRLQMEALQAEKTDRGMVLTLGDVLFDVNKAQLKPQGERAIQRLAEFMKEYEDRRVRVEGYTDSTGAESYNQELSRERAEAVKQALTDRGIASRRIETQGYGEAYPVASNDSAGGRQRNRRVEIVISDKEGDIESRGSS